MQKKETKSMSNTWRQWAAALIVASAILLPYAAPRARRASAPVVSTCASDAVERQSDDGAYLVWLHCRPASRPHAPDMRNVTLVTHITHDRKPALTRWCEHWRGPMSVSVYIRPGVDDAMTVIGDLQENECLREHAQMQLVVDAPAAQVQRSSRSSAKDMMVHYPFNVQRNAATDGSIGRLLFLLDVDFFLAPSQAAKERLFTAHVHRQIDAAVETIPGVSNSSVFVVPAVETVTKDVARPDTIGELKGMLASHVVCAFYGHYCRACHLPTNVNRFAGVSSPYLVHYEEGYEPYAVMDRRAMPRYHEAFIGRGWDKMSFFYELRAMGRTFVALPSYFLVHVGRGDMPQRDTEEYQRKQVHNRLLMEEFKKGIALRYYSSGPGRTHASAAQDADQVMARTVLGDAMDGAFDWAEWSSSMGFAKACVAKDRSTSSSPLSILKAHCGGVSSGGGETSGNNNKEGGIVSCSAVQPEGTRFHPNVTALQLDWVLDRSYHLATSYGVDSESACPGAYATLVDCPAACSVCVLRGDASTEAAERVLQLLCNSEDAASASNSGSFGLMPFGSAACDAVLSHVVSGDVHVRASAVLHAFHLVHRCTDAVAAACAMVVESVNVPCGPQAAL